MRQGRTPPYSTVEHNRGGVNALEALSEDMIAAVVDYRHVQSVGTGGTQLTGGGHAAPQPVLCYEGPQLGVHIAWLLPEPPARANSVWEVRDGTVAVQAVWWSPSGWLSPLTAHHIDIAASCSRMS